MSRKSQAKRLERARRRARNIKPPHRAKGPFVVKLQRSLGSSDETVLAYDRARTVLYESPMSDAVRAKYFSNGEFRVYVVAELVGTILNLGQPAADQEPGW